MVAAGMEYTEDRWITQQSSCLSFPALAGSLPPLRHSTTAFVAEHCDSDREWLDAVALVVTEAGSNVIRQAHNPPHTGRIMLTVRITEAPGDR